MYTKKNLRTSIGALIIALTMVFAATSADAAEIPYVLDGDWTDTTDATGTYGWDGAAVPGDADTGIINTDVTVTTVTAEIQNLNIGVAAVGNLVIESGGDLNVGNRLFVGHSDSTDPSTMTVNAGGIVSVADILWVGGDNANADLITGFLDLEAGGVINVGNHLWWAPGSGGDATIDIRGTLNQTSGILGLGTINAVDPSDGVATVNVYSGGIFGLNNIHGQGTSIHPGSVINLYGTGVITISGDHVDAIPQYITNGYIVAEDGARDVVISLDAGLTTVGVGPPPPPVVTPSSPFAVANETFSLSVTAGGTGYQWSDEGGDISDGGNISGATTTVLTFDPVTEGDAGNYTATFDDGEAKTVVSASYVLFVYPSGTTLPLIGLLGLGLLTSACALGGASALRRKQ